MGQELTAVVGQFDLKDIASPKLDKLNKRVETLISDFVAAERGIKKTEGTLSRFGNTVSRTGRRVGRGAARLGGGLFQGAAGGGLANAFTAIPFFGAAIAGGIASTRSAREQFTTGISLRRELDRLASDFQLAFRESSDNIINEIKRDGFFKKEDVQAAFTNLSDIGIDSQLIEDNRQILTDFAKSQGFTSLEQGIQALTGGQVRAGRGVANVDIARIQEIAPLLNNVLTSEQGFRQLLTVLNQSSDAIERNAETFDKDLGDIVRQSVRIQDEQQKTILEGAKGGEKFFLEIEKLTRVQNELARGLAESLAPAVNRGVEALDSFVDKLLESGSLIGGVGNLLKSGSLRFFSGALAGGARQSGGTVTAGDSFMVGEAGTERFTPRTSGKITSNNALRNERRGVVMNNNITINAANAAVGAQLENAIKDALNKFSRSTFRMNTGLPLAG